MNRPAPCGINPKITDADELVRLGKIFKVGTGRPGLGEYLDESESLRLYHQEYPPWALWQPGSREAVVVSQPRQDRQHVGRR